MAAILSQPQCVNSLAPGTCGCILEFKIFKLKAYIYVCFEFENFEFQNTATSEIASGEYHKIALMIT